MAAMARGRDGRMAEVITATVAHARKLLENGESPEAGGATGRRGAVNAVCGASTDYGKAGIAFSRSFARAIPS